MILRRIVLANLAIGALAVYGCQEPAPMTTATDSLRFLEADAVVIDGQHFFTQEGVRAATLLFDTAYQWRDSVDMHLARLTLTVYNEDGSERARVTSDRGTLDRRGDRMTARENVVLVVPAQVRRLETEELHYDPEGNRIWSDSAFAMTHDGRSLRGSAFTSDLEFRNFRVLGPGGG
jgi:LPS export ABC transporter protein LptC